MRPAFAGPAAGQKLASPLPSALAYACTGSHAANASVFVGWPWTGLAGLYNNPESALREELVGVGVATFTHVTSHIPPKLPITLGRHSCPKSSKVHQGSYTVPVVPLPGQRLPSTLTTHTFSWTMAVFDERNRQRGASSPSTTITVPVVRTVWIDFLAQRHGLASPSLKIAGLPGRGSV